MHKDISCVMCKHHRARPMRVQGMEEQTIHECKGMRDRITGAVITASCASVAGKAGKCGPAGKLFVAKEEALEAAE